MAIAPASMLDRADIQGDILSAYGNAFIRASYVFVGVRGADGRRLLRALAERVTTGEQWPKDDAGKTIKPETTLNVALTAAGLVALGVTPEVLATFSSEFRAGMAARCAVLGDAGPSAPDEWEPGLGTGQAHLLVTINARTARALQRELRLLRADVQSTGATIVAEHHAEMLSGQREHFGFSDGFGQPAIDGASEHKTDGGGVALRDGRWRPLALGEFILGYEDEDTRVDPEHRLPRQPADPLGRSGTYMVWRKLRQDVGLWRTMLREAAPAFDGGEDLLAAKIVGRWPNGAPLVSSPDAEDPDFDPETPGSNDFRYLDEDAGGRRCPLGAHIRRSNPRDALGWPGLDDAGLLAFRHRIIRRGMPYGPPLPAGTADDGAERGLIFVCFNASLSRQFESIQLQWLNDGNPFALGDDRDFLLGADSGAAGGKMTVQGENPFFLAPQRPFVTTRGGEYLFVPGITALVALAQGTEA